MSALKHLLTGPAGQFVWGLCSALLLAVLVGVVSALDTRDLASAAPHNPAVAIVQLGRRAPAAVPASELHNYGEGTRYLPNPPAGWVAYGPGQTVSWVVVPTDRDPEIRVTWSDRTRRVTTVWAVSQSPAALRPLRSEALNGGHLLVALIPAGIASVLLRIGLRRWSGAATPA